MVTVIYFLLSEDGIFVEQYAWHCFTIVLVKKCVVALQLENGERLVHEFNSDYTLFDILMHWKSQSKGYGVWSKHCVLFDWKKWNNKIALLRIVSSNSLTLEDTLDGVVCIYANQQVGNEMVELFLLKFFNGLFS